MISKLNNILKAEGISQINSGYAMIEPSENISSHDKLWVRINEFSPKQGWLCMTDRLEIINSTSDIENIEGYILYGEFASGNRSMHIRQNDHGWEVCIIISNSEGNMLRIKETFLAVDHKEIERLSYEVFWRPDRISGVFQPYVSRFEGFV